MRSKLLPYKIGLGVIGLFVLVLLILVVVGAGNYKHDTNLYQQATTIADKLNSYIINNDNIPANLNHAGINNAPTDISYTKLSGSSYKFCVNYRGNYDGFSSSQVEQQILNGGQSSSTSMNMSANGASSLYLNPYYHKGENCQTVKPLLWYNGYGTSYGNSSDPYAKCDSLLNNYSAYTNCINQLNSQLNGQSPTTTL